MKKLLTGIIAVTMTMALFTGCAGNNEKKTNVKDEKTTEVSSTTKADKKGMLVVSFGTSYADTRKVTLDAVQEMITDNFKEYEVRRAYTSNIITKKLKKRDNIIIDDPEEALKKMKEEGFTEVIVQPLHIIPGAEYTDLNDIVDKFAADKSFDKLVLGRPVLYRTEDYKLAIEAVKTQLPELNEGQAVVFMGHGTPHPANSSYALLQYLLEEEGMGNVYVGTVEGTPDLNNVIRRLKKDNIKEVTLMPFMVVAGDHANNDMAGDEDDSWKTILKSEGFKVNTYLHGLGENKGIQEIYMQHVKDCISGNPLMEEE